MPDAVSDLSIIVYFSSSFCIPSHPLFFFARLTSSPPTFLSVHRFSFLSTHSSSSLNLQNAATCKSQKYQLAYFFPPNPSSSHVEHPLQIINNGDYKQNGLGSHLSPNSTKHGLYVFMETLSLMELVILAAIHLITLSWHCEARCSCSTSGGQPFCNSLPGTQGRFSMKEPSRNFTSWDRLWIHVFHYLITVLKSFHNDFKTKEGPNNAKWIHQFLSTEPHCKDIGARWRKLRFI